MEKATFKEYEAAKAAVLKASLFRGSNKIGKRAAEAAHMERSGNGGEKIQKTVL